jgi:hypothetical protein
MLSHKVDLEKLEEPEKVVGCAYTSRYCTLPVPKYELSETCDLIARISSYTMK